MKNNELPACPVETTLTLIRNKWKVLIFRDLMPGSKRFGNLQRSIGQISQKVLTSNLKEMETKGIVHRKVYDEVPPRVEYSLTDLVKSLKPIIDSIIKNGKVIRPYLGVWAVDRQTAARNNVSYEGDGLLIVQLDPTGPMAKAGIVEGDTIAQIDGKNVSTLIELKEQIDAKSPGDTILVSYTHNGKMKSTQVTLGQSSSN